ncbi:MAG: insulinase family protein [Planctomycetales bacterium]|nr:insulinase family protein [Planctomycetales bacterium]
MRMAFYAGFVYVGVVLILLGCPERLLAADSNEGRFEYQSKTLGNGLEVISLEDFSCPIVAVQLWYHVGSKDEDPERQGFAHMFEHMMFRGTDRLGSTDHFDLVRQTGGSCNAYTSFDQTVYHEIVPANQLRLALWLEAERMAMLKIDQTSFDTERKVVEEERRMGLNRPYGELLEKILPEVFAGHPYRWAPIGSIPHLRSTSVPELRDFWTEFYVPSNATLVIVGAVKHDVAQQTAAECFGWIPKYDQPPRIDPPVRQPMTARTLTLKEKNAPAPIVGMLFRGVPQAHDDATALDMLTTILGGGDSSRLYRRLVADEQLAVAAMSSSMSLEQDGVVAVGAVLTPVGGDEQKVLDALREVVDRIQNETIDPAELQKVANQMLRSLVVRNLTIDSKASALGSAAVIEGDVERVNTQLQRIRAVTVGDLQRVARQYLNQDHMLTGSVKRNLLGTVGGALGLGKDPIESVPITGETEENAPAPGRPGVQRPDGYPEEAPVAGLLDYDPTPEYQEVTLANGLHLIVVENHEVPFVSAQLGFRAGAWSELKPGAASMAMDMLTKGTSQHTEGELAKELETYAIGLSGSGGMDNSSVGLSCLPEQLDRAVSLLAECVLTPTFPEDEFDKLVKQVSTSLTISQNTPAYLANRAFRQQLYGNHPYARSSTGELADVEALSVADVRQWYQTSLRPDQAHFVFAGDITMSLASELAQKYLGDWQVHGELPTVDVPPPPANRPTRIVLVDHPGKQTEIRVGQLAFTREDPDYFDSRVVSSYFGGAFSSRLNETIRVKKGLTYGARGGFSAARLAGEFEVSTFSKNESAVEAVQAIFDEIRRLQNEPPTEKEIQLTKSYFVGSFPAQRETPQQVAGDLWFIASHQLPADYFEQLLQGVTTATADECVSLAKKRVDPDQMLVVLAGPAKELKAPLEKIAPVTVVD